MGGFHIKGDPGRYISPTPRRLPFSRTGFIVLLIAALALFAGGTYICASEPAQYANVETALEEFLLATSKGDHTAAYEKLLPGHQGETADEFNARISGDPRYLSFKRLERRRLVRPDPRSNTYLYEGRAVYADGSRREINAEIAQVDGKWLISRIDIR